MTPEGFEPPAFGFGIQRAAVAPWSHCNRDYLFSLSGWGLPLLRRPAVSAGLGPQQARMQAEPPPGSKERG